MATEENNYLVSCDDATAELLRSQIKFITGSNAKESNIRGIGGGAETILFGTAALGALKALLDLIKTIIESGRSIKSVKVSDHEIKNPQKEDIEKLQKLIGESV